jgi:hypothetical protein
MPTSQAQVTRIYKAEHTQELYRHDYSKVVLKDWKLTPKSVKPGTPVVLNISGKEHHGYIHDVKGHQDNGVNITELGIIGASYVMRQSSQKLYKNVTADQVIVDIAKRYKFAYRVIPHSRVYPQLSQAGATDWEFMVKLAKQVGYSLRTEGACIYFQPLLKDFDDLIHETKVFTKVDQGVKHKNPIYYFKPLVGETLSHEGANKYATSIAGVDPYTGTYFKYTKQARPTTTRSTSQPEMFDRHATDVVANSYKTASLESAAADDRSTFPYVAEVQVLGDSSLRPGMPIYLENVGDEYSGYWTIINIEHTVKEEQTNIHLHTAVLRVGTDSLGAANPYKYPTKPSNRPIRHIIPNVKNTRIKPTTSLKSKGIAISQPKIRSLVERTNRADVKSPALSTNAWTSSNGNLGHQPVEKSFPPIVKAKLVNSSARR